jgi:hypothetical protein
VVDRAEAEPDVQVKPIVPGRAGRAVDRTTGPYSTRSAQSVRGRARNDFARKISPLQPNRSSDRRL